MRVLEMIVKWIREREMRVVYIVEKRSGKLSTRLVCISLGKRGDEPVKRVSELRRWERGESKERVRFLPDERRSRVWSAPSNVKDQRYPSVVNNGLYASASLQQVVSRELMREMMRTFANSTPLAKRSLLSSESMVGGLTGQSDE